MRLFAVGDIHGRYDLLTNLLDILEKHHSLDLTTDKLIFMGDYVDRGPQSYEVLVKLKTLHEEHPNNVIVLAGNHEWMMIDYFDKCDKWGLWTINGGTQTMQSLLENGVLDYDGDLPESLKTWLKELPLYHDEDGFFFSHAPISANRYFSREILAFNKDELIWTCGAGEEDEYAMRHSNGVIGVCGHVHALFDGIFEPRIYDHYIFTDAGCGCHPKAPLCAVEVISKTIIYSVL